ncbi:MAG: MobA/MobL family protein [Lachnospiraceae bacterium]|nr:MobA/MobL family protein [Lachnospiraceae bacterium]
MEAAVSDYPPKERRKAFVKRNSFVEMAKLHNLSGRITYISSHAKQEYLYEVYATEPDRAFWQELAKCNQEEFEKSGTNGKCIEARELIIALPESFIHYDHDYLLKRMADEFKKRYGVECFAALHHNKRKTNLHIHMIFAERKRLKQPVEKTATRNMFYDEHGHHVRTKKEIIDEDGNIRKGCKIIKKGEVYERKIFTVKDGCFKQESFLEEAKVFYTDLINRMVIDDKDRLSIFDKNGPYLATKKIGKNNPKAEEIKADNEIRMEWNRTVDRAIVSGVSETGIVELKKTEITDRVKKSVEQNGSKPELFGDIVKAAILLLERLITKVMQKVMDIAEKVVGKAADAEKEVLEETESRIHEKDEPIHQQEKEKIPLSINTHQKPDLQNKVEKLQKESTTTTKQSIARQIKTESKSVPVETKYIETERPPQPKPSVLVAKYPRLKEIDDGLKKQNKAIFEREKKRDRLKKELSECTGIFKGGRRKELQQEINSIDNQISNMKKRLSSIVREYKFDSVQSFYKEFNAARKEYLDYQAARTEWEKIYGDKAADPMSIRDRLRQKEQIVKERGAGRMHQTRQNDKGAR